MRTMKKQRPRNHPAREGERGAALITMLLISTLILAAGGALILSTATTATNTIDSTSSKQSFYAAESGLQMALNAMRGNTAPSAAITAGTKMSLRTAIMPNLSNGTADTVPCGTGDGDATVANPRCSLSGWLPYQNGVVPVDPNVTSSAFRLAVFDPDNSNMVAFTTDGAFETTGIAGLPGVVGVTVSPDKHSLSFTVGTTDITITYTPRTSVTATNSYPSAAADLGSFSIVKSNNLAFALPIGLIARFRLIVNQILPWQASPVTFKINLSTLSNCPTQMISLLFDKTSVIADGTRFAPSGLASKQLYLPCALAAAQSLNVAATVTAPDPRAVVVRSVGFGPKFSQKHLEMIVTRTILEFEAPATLTLRGADDCSAMTFDTGNSNAKDYSGNDRVAGGDAPRPAFAISGCDYQDVVDGTHKPGTVVGSNQVGILDNGSPVPAATPTIVLSYEGVDTPSYLKTADKARTFLNEMQVEAQGQGRYFAPASGTAMGINSSNAGTAADPKFTFVDGNVDLDGGDGLLIVTGEVNITGNTSYNGIIMVMGKGKITRSGGGNGDLLGAFVIAAFKRTWPASENGTPHPFTAPIFDTSGGGTSNIQFDSNAVQRALGAMGYVCGGVLEQ